MESKTIKDIRELRSLLNQLEDDLKNPYRKNWITIKANSSRLEQGSRAVTHSINQEIAKAEGQRSLF